jgi:hypothetical protein
VCLCDILYVLCGLYLMKQLRQLIRNDPPDKNQKSNRLKDNYRFTSTLAPRIISSTTPGSSKVDVSPRLVASPSPILRRIRRMILPERVFGRPATIWILSGLAIGPMIFETRSAISLSIVLTSSSESASQVT